MHKYVIAPRTPQGILAAVVLHNRSTFFTTSYAESLPQTIVKVVKHRALVEIAGFYSPEVDLDGVRNAIRGRGRHTTIFAHQSIGDVPEGLEVIADDSHSIAEFVPGKNVQNLKIRALAARLDGYPWTESIEQTEKKYGNDKLDHNAELVQLWLAYPNHDNRVLAKQILDLAEGAWPEEIAGIKSRAHRNRSRYHDLKGKVAQESETLEHVAYAFIDNRDQGLALPLAQHLAFERDRKSGIVAYTYKDFTKFVVYISIGLHIGRLLAASSTGGYGAGCEVNGILGGIPPEYVEGIVPYLNQAIGLNLQ